MLKLGDFFYLPELDPLIEQISADGPGLTIVAGLDPRAPASALAGGVFLPGGHNAIFRILLYNILDSMPSARAMIIAQDRKAVHLPRRLCGRAHWALVHPPYTYAGRIASMSSQQMDLLAIDSIDVESAPAALQVAGSGVRVLAQMDTVFSGINVARQLCARQLLDGGVTPEQLRNLRWVIAVQRMMALCPHCRQPIPDLPVQWPELCHRYPALSRFGEAEEWGGAFFRAVGCERCNGSGRRGDVAVFDVFRADPDAPSLFALSSVLPLHEYALHLAMLGYLALDDVLHLDDDLLHRTYRMFAASEAALGEAYATLQRKVAELEASNRVLQRQTGALISLQDIGQALIASTDLKDLADRICRYACGLCGADLAILYLARSDEQVEILAVSGWDAGLIGRRLDARRVFGAPGAGALDTSSQPMSFGRMPPGVPSQGVPATFKAGLRVPLIAQQQRVGTMIVHARHKAGFLPGEVSLLQTFANQAALAIQRAGLIEQLRDKIAQLEKAQIELLQKERMEHELSLARRVQQSVLPKVFPSLPGYTFAARNEPARQVGGDFYDVIKLDDDHFGLVIADVSDKGMPAALYMALTRSLILAEARRVRSPCVVLRNVNQLLLELGEANMFVTVFYGVVDVCTRQLTFARAGHDRPLLLRQDAVLSLGGQGTFLGFWDTADLGLTEEQVALLPGDRLVLYTDGLTDTCTADGQLFSAECLRALLQTRYQQAPAALCEAVFAHLITYRGNADQFDDMTMLVAAVES